MTQAEWSTVLEAATPEVRSLATGAQHLLAGVLTGAQQETDVSARLLGFTYAPGTYKGLVAAVAVHKGHVNIMFSKGAELAETDTSGLLEGTGKKARHIKITDAEQLADPRVREIIEAAAALA